MAVEVNVSCNENYGKLNQISIKFILPSDDVCNLKPSWEDCEVKTTKQGFTFNGATGVCEPLTFTGCKPGGNLFKSLESCESVCVSGGNKLGDFFNFDFLI